MRSYWLSSVAGSGKTRFIADLVSFKLPCNDKSSRILCISFSRSTVKEMHRAIFETTSCLNDVLFSTVHGFSSSLMSVYPNDLIVLKSIVLDLLWREYYLRDKLSFNNFIELFYKSEYFDSNFLIDSISDFIKTDSCMQLANSIARQFKSKHGITLYNDLLLLTLDCIEKKVLPNLPRHILIDEAQDLTELQWSVIEKIFYASRSIYSDATLTIVGDPNQIVYEFQGSSKTIWQKRKNWWGKLHIKKEFRQSVTCYRCGRAIVDVINQLYNPKHEYCFDQSWIELLCNDKQLINDECAALVVLAVKTILQRYSVMPEDVLVLVKRRGALLQSLLKQFSLQCIQVSGLSNSIENDLENLLPFFRVVENCTDESVFELLQVLHNNCEMYSRIRNRNGSVYSVVEKYYPDLIEIIVNLSSAKNDLGRFICVLAKYTEIKESVFELANTYCAETLGHSADFLEYCRKQQSVCTKVMPGCVRLLTIHSAKGLQAKYVVIADSYESPYRISANSLRKDQTSEEYKECALQASKNLLYVALTRAERGVFLCGAGKMAQDSFGDFVSRGLIDLGVRRSVGKFGNCLRLEYNDYDKISKRKYQKSNV